jgi:hypothetical protein
MTALAVMQLRLRDALFERGNDGQALQLASELVHATPGISAAEHIRIYRRAVLSTLETALRKIFPIAARLVGTEFFAAMAREFIRATPSRSPDLAEYGQHFGDFIADFPPANGLAYLPDVARLEWAWQVAFNAADEPLLDIGRLQNVPPEDYGNIIFQLPASGTVLESDYPVADIWAANQADQIDVPMVDLKSGGQCLLVWRRGYDVRIDNTGRQAATLLTAIAAGTDFNQLSAAPEQAGIESTLPTCIQNGWIGGFTCNQP